MRRLVAILLIGGGATLMFSAAMNLLSAWMLLEASDETALGFSRGEVWRWFGAGLVAGALMVGWGIRLRRRARGRADQP